LGVKTIKTSQWTRNPEESIDGRIDSLSHAGHGPKKINGILPLSHFSSLGIQVQHSTGTISAPDIKKSWVASNTIHPYILSKGFRNV
jgi:hypothetical protein